MEIKKKDIDSGARQNIAYKYGISASRLSSTKVIQESIVSEAYFKNGRKKIIFSTFDEINKNII